MAHDATFKQFIKEFLKDCDIRVNEPVGKLPLAIDLVITCPQGAATGIELPVFKENFSAINIVEFKSGRDNPDTSDLPKLLGYVGLYCAQHGIGIDIMDRKVTAWYISARKPAFIDDLLLKKAFEPTPTTGLYRLLISSLFPCFVLVIDELDFAEANLPLLGFGTGEILKKFVVEMNERRLRHELSTELEKHLTTICVVNHGVLQDMTETKEILPDIFAENLKLVIQDMGLSKVLELIGTKETIEALVEKVGVDEIEKILSEKRQKSKHRRK